MRQGKENIKMEQAGTLDKPVVSVIIPVFNDSEILKICLKALLEQDYPRTNFEILVVDNGSNPSIGKSFLPEDINVLYESKPSSYSARNTGIKNAAGKFLAFTDADCIPAKDWLSKGVSYLQQKANDTIIGGHIDVFPKAIGRPNAYECYDMALGLRQKRYISKGNFAATANMLVWKSIFDEIGNFNGDLKSGADYEWGIRAVKSGKKIYYCPNVLVKHPARDTLKSIVTKYRRMSGGISDIQKFKSNVQNKAKGIKSTPIDTIKHILRDENIPRISQKLSVFFVAVIIQSTIIIEKIRLFLGFGSERR